MQNKIFFLVFYFWVLSTKVLAQTCEGISFRFFWGNDALSLESPLLVGKDTIYISKLQFYVSNVFFYDKKNKKKIVHYPKLIALNNNLLVFPKKINLKNFSKISFGLGLDEATNTGKSGQKQDLDPQNGMFWTWESGYIFWKMEGYFFEDNKKRGLIFHLGRNNCYQEAFFLLENLQIENQHIIIKIDLQKIWENQSLKSYPNNIMEGKYAEILAKKIVGLFK